MNISPSTGNPKVVKADIAVAERFVAFCQMLANYSDRMDVKSIGSDAKVAKKAAEKLLESLKLEATPKSKRDSPEVSDESGETGDSPDDARSPGEGEVDS